jgi:hypothetical protein
MRFRHVAIFVAAIGFWAKHTRSRFLGKAHVANLNLIMPLLSPGSIRRPRDMIECQRH